MGALVRWIEWRRHQIRNELCELRQEDAELKRRIDMDRFVSAWAEYNKI